MGVQQHRRSKSNIRNRRAQQKIEAPSFGNCPQCHSPKEPHKICPECGFYKGKEVVAKAAE